MGILGTFCITISFILSIYSILGFLISMNFKTEELKISARWSSYLTLPIISIAFSILVYSFVTHDFSIKYVFNHSNLAMEPIYTWVAIYAGNEGSLLYISAVISIGSFLTIKSLNEGGSFKFNVKFLVCITPFISSFQVLGFDIPIIPKSFTSSI